MKRVSFIIEVVVLSVLLVSSVLAASVDPDVVSALERGESVPIIVTLKNDVKAVSVAAVEAKQEKVLQKLDIKEETLTKESNFDLDHQFNVINGFSGDATEEAV